MKTAILAFLVALGIATTFFSNAVFSGTQNAIEERSERMP